MIIFKDEDILIRSYQPADLNQLPALLGNATTMQFWPAPFSASQVANWQHRMIDAYKGTLLGRWAVVQVTSGQLIGDAGIPHSVVNGKEEYDLGYIVDHRFWNRGFGTRIAAACLDHGFRRAGLTRIIAHMASSHIGSRKVAEKIGMLWETDFINQQNRGYLHHLFALSNAQYPTVEINTN